MSHPLVWPGKYFFYAVGNTPAVCLTRDLPPEETANILLLGCGDPRHVLQTIFSEPANSSRVLDFTCCDFEPGVLARNVLLFSLVADEAPQDVIWNIFYHLYLDAETLSLLHAQCRKLINASTSAPEWRSSPYGTYLRMATDHTLAELRRHWALYEAMQDLPPRRLSAIREAFREAFRPYRNFDGVLMTSARAAGPLIAHAVTVSTDHAKSYLKTGTTFSNPKQVASAKFLNPTCAYSLAGEGCAVHYATDPLAAFHSAALFGNAKGQVRPADAVRAAQAEFSEWCSAFRRSVAASCPSPRIRFCLSEATALCRSLRAFHDSGSLSVGIPIAQFKTQLLRLSSEEYLQERAPAVFNVVETSNLIDHIALLNLLISVIPILSPSPSSVLYTESLLFRGEDATKEFASLLYSDIGTIGLIFDLCPVDYLSGFTSRSNTHELITYKLMSKGDTTQFHQVTTWKRPSSCDSDLQLHVGRFRLPPVFDSRQLGTLLFDMYHAMFEQEDAMTFMRQNQANLLKAISSSNLLHYMREGYAMLLRLVRDRLQIPHKTWLEVMDRFLDLEETDQTMPMNTVNRNDLYAHLYRQGVHIMDYYRFERVPKIGRFAGWETVPPVVRVILSVPREKIDAFERAMRAAKVGTPPLHCDVRGTWSHNIFNAVHVAFGRVITTGTKSNPRVLFEEDPDGPKGHMPLVASFCLPSFLLTKVEAPENLRICFSVRSTTGTAMLFPALGMELGIYSARLMDEEHVFVVPEASFPSPDFEEPSGPLLRSGVDTLLREIGTQEFVAAELDEQCELVQSLASKVRIEDDHVKNDFGSRGAMPQISQLSPCIMRLSVAGCFQDVVFPFPVVGTQNKLRLARKSLYIEVVVPISGPFLKPDGMKLNPFPVVGTGKALHSWNIHRLSLAQLPVLDPKAPNIAAWLNAHVGSMLSARERSNRKKHRADALMFVKDTIHAMFVTATAIQGAGSARRVISLRDEKTNNCDTLFFISDIRYDLQAHTMVCDGYVLPLTHDIMPKIASFFGDLVFSNDMAGIKVFEGEMQAWKQLIPAFVERCRTWEHGENCEYLARKQVPLTLEMEIDPLCSCGRGKDVDGLLKAGEWKKYAPYVTRIAVSPLFAVSYLETIGRDPDAHKCSVCRGRGKPKLKACSGCTKVRYCSQACQKKDWPRHKPHCKA
ncbi:hypothetical protein GY45DRAFT_1288114 [Cubamyces sp. BRFM 1775]|nr:hypothetical protein GY45DRAFT_1288114 [Cubamyces sp. BRFM 1775]